MKGFAPIIGLALIALAAALTGCASSSNYKKGEAAASGLTATAAQIDAGDKKIDETLAAMNDLVQNPQPDLRPQYKKFSTGVDDLDLLSKHVQQSFESMSARSKQYFARWEKEAAAIQNEDVRAQSAARKAEVSSALENVKRLYSENQTTFRPFMSDLRDIQKYLGTDLTASGVASIKNTTTKATANAAKVKDSVKNLATEFRKLGASMAPVAESSRAEATAR